jgi:transposase, IS5 family
LPVRLIAGLMVIKHMEGLSDAVLSGRFLDSPYAQFFCGQATFRPS